MFLVTIGLLCCTGIGHAQDIGEDPSRSLTKLKVKQIFERLTRNLPSRIHIIVKSKVISEPAGEREIWAAARANAKRIETNTRQVQTDADVKELDKLFRIYLSGFKEINYELWRYKKRKLYRLDKIDLSIGTAVSDWIDVNIWDTTFTNIPHFSDGKQGMSVTLQWDTSRRAEEL